MQVKAPNLLRQAVLATTGWAGLFNSFKFTRVKTWGVTICTRMAFLLTTIASVLKHKMVGIMDVTTAHALSIATIYFQIQKSIALDQYTALVKVKLQARG